jgi:hypothetical protein
MLQVAELVHLTVDYALDLSAAFSPIATPHAPDALGASANTSRP